MPGQTVSAVHVTRHPWRRYTKFLVVGGMNAVVDLFVLNVLLLVAGPVSSLWLTVCNSVAVACAILNSYLWNRRWTFAESSDGSVRERFMFIVQALVNIAVNDITVVLLMNELTPMDLFSPVIASNIAKGMAMFVSSCVSYVFMNLWVFRSGLGKSR